MFREANFLLSEGEEMKKLLLAMYFAVAVAMLVTPASATEQWDLHFRGFGEGWASGALAPEGFYFTNDAALLPFWHSYGVTTKGVYNPSEANSGNRAAGYLDVPVLLWSTGCKFLGASYGVAVAEPFDYTNLRSSVTLPASIVNILKAKGITLPPLDLTGSQLGLYNTVLVPYILSWKLSDLNPCLRDFYVRTDLQVALNDGTTSTADSVASVTKIITATSKNISKTDGHAYLWSSNNVYAFQPSFAISWLHSGWNLSARFVYDTFTKDTDTNYQSGDEIGADFTASHTWGKWTFGFGATNTTQIQDDKFNAGKGYMSQPNTKVENWVAGPLVGYNFGPCSLMLLYNFPLYTQNQLGGEQVDLRLVIPLGNPFPMGGK
jgi:hypothetical protein